MTRCAWLCAMHGCLHTKKERVELEGEQLLGKVSRVRHIVQDSTVG
jgi:hypothetical protein